MAFTTSKHVVYTHREAYLQAATDTVFAKKPILHYKQGFFAMQTRLVYTPNKACLESAYNLVCFSQDYRMKTNIIEW